jgi:hypothetical protein
MTEREKELVKALRGLLAFDVSARGGMPYDKQERQYDKTRDMVETLLARIEKEEADGV